MGLLTPTSELFKTQKDWDLEPQIIVIQISQFVKLMSEGLD